MRLSKQLGILLAVWACVGNAEEEMALANSWDSKLTADISYPPSMMINFWAGLYEKFNLARLRKLNRDLAPFEHGYIRPHIRLMTSLRVNQIEPRFDLYPFTFLGLTGGWIFSQRSLGGLVPFERFTKYDCGAVSCDGWNYLPFAEVKFKWGYNSYFGVFFVRRDWAWSEGITGGFDLSYDPNSGLLFDSNFDRLDQFWVLAGAKVSEYSQLLGRYKYLGWHETGNYRRDISLIFTHSFNDEWSTGVELTRAFRNDGFHYNIAALRLSWNIKKSPAAEDALD